MEVIIPWFGVFWKIHSDRGTHFVEDMLKQLYMALGIESKLSSAYSPQSQGVCERYHSTYYQC